MKILITGSKGMLGKAIVKKFKKDYELIELAHSDLDITNREMVFSTIDMYKPDIIINCAAYTNVPTVEYNEEAYAANTLGPRFLAEAAKQYDKILVHFSTDYVFDGNKLMEDSYNENVEMKPLNSYGKTKKEGDENIIAVRPNFYIFRTSWLFGDGENFVTKMLALKDREEIQVVCDQVGSPTYTEDLADIVKQVIEKKLPYGIYNATNLGYCSWYDFARLILPDANIIPIGSDDYDDGIDRPRNSQLSKNKLLKEGISIPMYQDALDRYLATKGE